MQLYKINQAIEDLVDSETGEITSLDALHQLKMQRNEKAENIGLLIKNKKANKEAYSKEIKVLQARMKAEENSIRWLEEYLLENLKGEKFETPRLQIRFRKSDTLEIKSTAGIPAEFLVPQEPKVDKISLKKAVKAGAVFEGVELITKQNMQIK